MSSTKGRKYKKISPYLPYMDTHQHRMDWQRGWWDFRHRRTYYLDTRSSMSGWENQDLVTKLFFCLLYVPKTDLPEGLINDSSLEQDFDLLHSLLHMPCSGYGPMKCFLNWHSTLQARKPPPFLYIVSWSADKQRNCIVCGDTERSQDTVKYKNMQTLIEWSKTLISLFTLTLNKI